MVSFADQPIRAALTFQAVPSWRALLSLLLTRRLVVVVHLQAEKDPGRTAVAATAFLGEERVEIQIGAITPPTIPDDPVGEVLETPARNGTETVDAANEY